MNPEELLLMLDIESPAELVYFEQFADLMEYPHDIPQETLTALAEGMEPGALQELVEGYFEEIIQFVPDDESDLYTLLQNIATTLAALAEGSEEDSAGMFAEELYRFRSWYLLENSVIIKDFAEGTEREVPPMEALTVYRVQNFTDEDYSFDFTDALDYRLDEYIVSLGSLAEDNYDDGDDYDGSYDEDEDYTE